MKRVHLIIVVVAMLVGCYKSDLTNTTHPDEGSLVVDIVVPTVDPDSDETTDPDATSPESFTIIIDGDEVPVDEDGLTIIPDLEPGEYIIYAYSNTEGIKVVNTFSETGGNAVVTSTTVDAGIIPSLTEDLYFGRLPITVSADEIIVSEIILTQITRTIKFNLQIVEGDPNRIKSATASLNGIAQQWECIEDIPTGDAVTINPSLTQGESLTKSTDNDFLTGSIKILGINGDKQIFKLDIEYTDGETQTITSDLSEEVAGSNETKTTPLILSGDLNTPIEGSIEGATIDNWTQGAGGSQTVN